ncbi:MAG: hypothetical protein QJR04_25985 [Burkholderia multivorans]|uniref:hypothetical protein n=1 Tax=Burkholderia multivorans TaxID=87883 RepID=UPI000D0098C8|nr:hypothetical protein [Burkholderia multivorans]MCA8412841.1 hypothetical protein [Burkholderia multivorans]MDI3304801.1 hypothetical protein [Burkholderia multivorans]PRE63877.1 hypothetical protein C6P82_17495 [Burkholderia multivorans]
MIDFDDYFQFGLSYKLGGRHLDKWVTVYSPQINDNARFLRLRLETVEQLQSMIDESDDTFVLVDNPPVFCCCYDINETCPVPRIYHFTPGGSLAEFASVASRLERHGFRSKNMLGEHKFLERVGAQSAAERIRSYKEAYQKSRHLATARALAEGRRQNTFVTQTALWRTDGCLLCGNEDVMLITTTWGTQTGESTQLLLCQPHAKEAFQAGSVLNYLAAWCGSPNRLALQPLDLSTDKAYLSETIELVDQELDCKVEKVKEIEREVTGIRRISGFTVILRIHSTVKRGYSYMVNLPDGSQVARIDDAPDHHDVNFFPDHRHTGLPVENRSAVPSFSTGHARIDLPGIKAEIERIEEKYKNHWVR